MLISLHVILSANKFSSRVSIITTITEITYAENNIIWKRQDRLVIFLSSSLWSRSTGPVMAHHSCHTLLSMEDDCSRLLDSLCDSFCFLSGSHVKPLGIFLHSVFHFFFFPNWESSSLESCTVVHEIREIVLSKFDASNVSIKDSVTRYGIVFPSSMCLHSALSHSYLKEGMLSAPKERVWRALQLRQWIQYWGFSLACDKKK